MMAATASGEVSATLSFTSCCPADDGVRVPALSKGPHHVELWREAGCGS